MGYPYSAYAVDLAKLRAAPGSKALARAIGKKLEGELERNTEWFAADITNGAPTLESALSEIIAGTTPKKSKHGFQYGYAVELLTRHFGVRIDEDELGYGAHKAIDPFLKKAKQATFDELTKSGVSPIPIPAIADFPLIGTLDDKAIAALLAALTAAEPFKDKKVDAWCGKARKKKRGIVWFAY